MNISLKDDYNLKYKRKEFYWGGEPHALVVESSKYLSNSAKVLDLGCGEGRNSLYLARQGFNVTAVDISEVGIKKLQDISIEEKLKIQTNISDIDTFLAICTEFDAIFCINALQFIDQKVILQVIDKIKQKTKKSGFDIIASFVAENKKQRKIVLSKGRYVFNKDELKEIYKNWDILFYKEKLGDWETHGEQKHRHFVVKLITRKY